MSIFKFQISNFHSTKHQLILPRPCLPAGRPLQRGTWELFWLFSFDLSESRDILLLIPIFHFPFSTFLLTAKTHKFRFVHQELRFFRFQFSNPLVTNPPFTDHYFTISIFNFQFSNFHFPINQSTNQPITNPLLTDPPIADPQLRITISNC